MSYFDYQWSRQLCLEDPPFYAIIMAAMRRADTNNLARLTAAWPEVWQELRDRHHAPGGFLKSDPECPPELK